MANYNKSFNFRNGVQVDTDKFIVNTAGLVGIGSTIPTNYLDVNGGVSVTGDIQATGLVTSSQLYVSGVSTFFSNVGIGTTNPDGAADTNNTTILNAGIVTAVRYYGDGSTLSGVRSIAVNGWDIDSTVGSGIAYTTFSVGIGTTNPNGRLDVTQDRDTDYDTTTDQRSSAQIISLNSTEGTNNFASISLVNGGGTQAEGSINLVQTGNYIGDLTFKSRTGSTSWSEKLRITHDGKVGIASTSPDYTLDVGGTTETEVLRVTGTSLLVGNVDLTNNLTVNGTSTFNDDATFTGDNYNVVWDKSDNRLEFADLAKLSFGDGTDPNYQMYYKPDTDDIRVEVKSGNNYVLMGDVIDIKDSTGDTHLIIARGNLDGNKYVELLHNDNERLRTNGVGVTITSQIDAGTLNLDQGYLESINSTGVSTVSVGQSVGVGKSTGILRFGSAIGTLDLINNDDGDLIFGLDGHAIAGINTGDFKWTTRTTDTLMTLTGIGGSLGINEENPIYPLHVGGSSTITGAAWFGNDINVKNNINCDGNITGTFTLQNPITSNVNSTGVSTVGGIHVYGGAAGFNGLGIGTDQFDGSVKLDVTGQTLFRGTSGVGINTTAVDAFFPLVVNGNMRVNKITGFAPQIGIDTGVSLQYNKVDKITTTGAGVTVAGVCTATDFSGHDATAADFPNGATSVGVITATGGFVSDTGSPVKITVSGSTLTFTVGGATTSLTLF